MRLHLRSTRLTACSRSPGQSRSISGSERDLRRRRYPTLPYQFQIAGEADGECESVTPCGAAGTGDAMAAVASAMAPKPMRWRRGGAIPPFLFKLCQVTSGHERPHVLSRERPHQRLLQYPAVGTP
eukprot:1384880-Prymnesium_polylepis.1